MKNRIVKTMSTKYPGRAIYILYINNKIENFSNDLTNIKILAELSGLNSESLSIEVEILKDKIMAGLALVGFFSIMGIGIMLVMALSTKD